MGIPGFFGQWLQTHVNAAVVRNSSRLTDVVSLAFDLNGMIYEAINSVYGTDTFESLIPAEAERLFLSNLSSLMMELVSKFQPQYCLIIAIDGVVPLAKLQQQKQRRVQVKQDGKINSHHITPGTEMMAAIHQSIETFITLYRKQLPPKVIYSSYLVPGEAEHKIMDLYRQGEIFDDYHSKKDHHVLCGLDADLIILSLVSPVDNIIIFRDRQSDMVNIEELKKYLLSIRDEGAKKGDLAAVQNPVENQIKNESVYNDFCIMMLLIGNDFLPHMPALENIADGINFMLNIYKQTTGGFSKNNKIQWAAFHKFLSLLAEKESKELVTQYGLAKNKSQLITNNITNNKFNFTKYRDEWYNRALLSNGDPKLQDRLIYIINKQAGLLKPAKKGIKEEEDSNLFITLREFSEEKVRDMVNAYLLSLSWVFLYYKEGMKAVNHDLLYPYYYTPLLRDIVDFTQQLNDKNVLFGYRAHPAMIEFTVLQQLVAVLPFSAKELLPEELRPLFSLDSPLLDLYPHEFKIDLDGKKNEHQGVMLLPFIDKNRIYEAVEQINFERERAELWKPLDNEVYELPQTTVKGERKKIVVGDPSYYASGAAPRGRGGFNPSRGRGGFNSSDRGGRGGFSSDRGGRGGSNSSRGGEQSSRGRGGVGNLVRGNVQRKKLEEIDF